MIVLLTSYRERDLVSIYPVPELLLLSHHHIHWHSSSTGNLSIAAKEQNQTFKVVNGRFRQNSSKSVFVKSRIIYILYSPFLLSNELLERR